jgi:aminoglycoside 6'-N-acetyltransferase
MLAEWLAAPHVEEWWREPYDVASIEARYGPCVDRVDPTEVFVVEHSGHSLGLIQRYRIDDDPNWSASLAVAGIPAASAGIDYLIGVETMTGEGLGPLIIDKFVDDTWRIYGDISAIVVAVDQENKRSWRALEKCGFRRIWTGTLESEDPSDPGTSFVYSLEREPGRR